jgi:hypothetical protein
MIAASLMICGAALLVLQAAVLLRLALGHDHVGAPHGPPGQRVWAALMACATAAGAFALWLVAWLSLAL